MYYLLTREVVEVSNLPDIIDVNKLIKLIQNSGVIPSVFRKLCITPERKGKDFFYQHIQEYDNKPF